MARRSRTAVSCCMVLIAMTWGAISPLMAQTREGPRGIPSGIVSSTVVSVLARQIAFVKSFSVGYPYQFRQGKDPAKAGTATVDEIRTQGK